MVTSGPERRTGPPGAVTPATPLTVVTTRGVLLFTNAPPLPEWIARALTSALSGFAAVPTPVALGMSSELAATSVVPANEELKMAPVALSCTVFPGALITVVFGAGGVLIVKLLPAP